MRPTFTTGRRRGRDALRAAAILALAALLPACTALPEWADPGGWFEEEPEAPSRISAAEDTTAAQAGDFPNLASVPDQPRTATPRVERVEIAKGLAADRSNAQYSGQRLIGDESAQGAQSTQAAPAGAPPAPVLSPPPAQAAPAQAAPVPPRTVAPPVPRAQIAATPQPAQPPQVPQAPLAGVPGRSELAGIIYFAHGSTALSSADQAVLSDIALLHRQRGGAIRVVGHASARTGTTDPVNHRLANLEVSQQRADAVATALVQMGVTRGKVVVEARADTQPIYHEFMVTGEAGNRRAEIFLEY